jgi:hypothetical protein
MDVMTLAPPVREQALQVETTPLPASPRGNGAHLSLRAPIVYPESDGLPMSDNTKQFRYIVSTQGGIDSLFAEDPNVFVAGDLLWYPVEGDNKTRIAPDTMVAFGRPKGDRGSYLQWREDNIAPQVVFEILSPGNTAAEMTRKYQFYRRHGVEEYYLYDPDRGELSGWLRDGDDLVEIEQMEGWVSPRLGIRFSLVGTEMVIYRPDGDRFETFVELQQRAKQESQRAEQERQRAERLMAQLRAMGVEPDVKIDHG